MAIILFFPRLCVKLEKAVVVQFKIHPPLSCSCSEEQLPSRSRSKTKS